METNPLVSFRIELGLSQFELAKACGLSQMIILLQEHGIPHHLHPRFLQKFPASIELIPGYHDFRRAKRRANWPNGTVVPQTGPEFAAWLRQSPYSINTFSEAACLPQIDISYALHHFRLPSTVVRFFEEVNEREPAN